MRPPRKESRNHGMSLKVSASVIVWLCRIRSGHADERRAQQLVAGTYFLLVALILVESTCTLVGGHHPAASWVGIGRAAVTASTMPLLARAKRRVGTSWVHPRPSPRPRRIRSAPTSRSLCLLGCSRTHSRFGGGPIRLRRLPSLLRRQRKGSTAGAARAATAAELVIATRTAPPRVRRAPRRGGETDPKYVRTPVASVCGMVGRSTRRHLSR